MDRATTVVRLTMMVIANKSIKSMTLATTTINKVTSNLNTDTIMVTETIQQSWKRSILTRDGTIENQVHQRLPPVSIPLKLNNTGMKNLLKDPTLNSRVDHDHEAHLKREVVNHLPSTTLMTAILVMRTPPIYLKMMRSSWSTLTDR